VIADPDLVRAETIEMVQAMVAAPWFYYLDLIGTFAFATSGAIKAYKLDYDYFGTFLLVTLPAVGGGTLRDVVVGGNRHPPFIFHDSTYLYIVFGVVIAAAIVARYYRPEQRARAPLNLVLAVFDTIGLAAFTVIGAKVALVSGLDWFWAPLLAALTCSGGGVISNAVTGHESSVLKGEIYEEVAAGGGLFLVLGYSVAHLAPAPRLFMAGTVLVTLAGTFAVRWWVIRTGALSPTLRSGGDARTVSSSVPPAPLVLPIDAVVEHHVEDRDDRPEPSD
jgi:NitT/TauT family transport system substrate-binding protein